jgi:hypothetical protein
MILGRLDRLRRFLVPILNRARRVLLPCVLFAAAVFLVWFTNKREPIETWLLWPYAAFWSATIVWVIGCLGIGHAALRLLPRLGLRFRERVLFDFAVGVLLFAGGLFVVGLLGLLRGPFYFVYPLVLAAVGIRYSAADARRAWRHFREARKRACLRPSVIHKVAVAFGTLGLAIVYLSIMVPENAAFDARSYHLPIAEHFAVGGRIGKFPEGWFAGALPHLASWLYTWPFTLRAVNLYGHIELAAHLEFVLFVATVFSAPLLAEALLPGRRARGTWAVFFLFPGLFLYDSSLGLAADHVLAFWAAPLALSLVRWLRRPSDVARGALAGLMLAGAALTKYQSMYLLIPACLVIGFAVARELWRSRRPGAPDVPPPPARPWASPLALAVAAIVGTAPHWLANAIWHGNPVYPLARHFFPSHPLAPGWPGTALDAQFELTGTLGEKLRETATNVFAFSFVPHDWAHFHRDVPVFGFLFTLTLPVLLLSRTAARARVLAAATLLGLCIWFWTYHEDRYLQSLLPWMVACTAVALRVAWEAGILARIGGVLLVAVQLAWGNDVPWFPTHAMIQDVPALHALRLLSSTYRGDVVDRWHFNTGLEILDHALPKDAYVVFHEEYLRLGLNRRAIQDSLRLQAGIDYGQLARPDRVHDYLKGLGATHLVWNVSASINKEVPVSGELAFFGYALRYGEDRRYVGGFAIARLPATRPPPREPGLVTYVGCDTARNVPLAEIDRLVAAPGGAGSPPVDPAPLVAAAEYVVVEMRCQSKVSPQVMAPFVEAPHWGDLTLWVRR